MLSELYTLVLMSKSFFKWVSDLFTNIFVPLEFIMMSFVTLENSNYYLSNIVLSLLVVAG